MRHIDFVKFKNNCALDTCLTTDLNLFCLQVNDGNYAKTGSGPWKMIYLIGELRFYFI